MTVSPSTGWAHDVGHPREGVTSLTEREFVVAQNPTHIGLRTADAFAETLRSAGFLDDRDTWRASFFPLLGTVKKAAGRWTELFRYRLCLLGRKPAA
jgi:hypothetical protein